MPDLTTLNGVRALMRSSRDVSEWNANCAIVRDANVSSSVGRRKEIEELMISGLYEEVSQSWKPKEV
jgi:hypothetical protein